MKLYGTYMKKIAIITSLFLTSIRRNPLEHTIGFRKYLKMRGVGFKFILEDNKLIMHVGFSHTLEYSLPTNVTIKFSRKYKMARFYTIDFVLLTNMIAYLRKLKVPDPYKGKGIRYLRDPVLRKEGKKRKT